MTVAGEEASVGGTTGDALSKDGVPFAGTNSSGGSHDHEHEEEIDEKAMGQIIGVAILGEFLARERVSFTGFEPSGCCSRTDGAFPLQSLVSLFT